MKMFEIRELKTENIEKELELIGFDEGYKYIASDKFRYKNYKIYGLNTAQANIIKQTALSIGADCATNKNVVTGQAESSDIILGGSISQLKKIASKLENQPFKLKYLAEKLNNLAKSNRKTKLAGILNITPNSFSDGGKYIEPKDAQKRLVEMIEEGADIIDIGAESTKPYSEPVPASEQIERLKDILTFIQKENIQIPISIDTRSSEVADFVLNNGAKIINDVSGFEYDSKLAEIVAKYNADVIIQHSKGTPENMQINPEYKNVVEEVYTALYEKIKYAKSLGIENIIADIGIGFGKTKAHNIELLDRIEEFYSLNCPIMAGISRKRLLGVEDNDNELKDALTLAYSYPLIVKGVDYLRVHNVKLHRALINSLTD